MLVHDGGNDMAYMGTLLSLGKVLGEVVTDCQLRDALVKEGTIDIMLDTIHRTLSEQRWPDERLVLLHIRVLRGVLLLVRNLVPFSDVPISSAAIIQDVALFNTKTGQDHALYKPCIQVFLEVLANSASKFGLRFCVDPTTFAVDIVAPLTSLSVDQTISRPISMVISASLVSEDAARALLQPSTCSAVTDFVAHTLADHQELLPFVEQLVCHESFHDWILADIEHNSADFLGAAVLTITNKEDWTNAQYVTILDWVLDVINQCAPRAIALLQDENYVVDQLDTVHLILVRALDILADLGKFNHTQRMVLQREALDVIVPLFRAVQENTTVKKIKIEDPTKKVFPEVSSLIIEVLANTCHSSFEAQEKIRELHGLELVLSSCVIDDHNPFMKERAILCLRFLLEKNPKNQQFVAELEAENVADSTALEEAGYEVDLVDGKVKVKKK